MYITGTLRVAYEKLPGLRVTYLGEILKLIIETVVLLTNTLCVCCTVENCVYPMYM